MWFCGGWEGPAAIPGAAQESNLPALCFPAPLSFHSAYHSPQRVDFAPKIQCLLPRFCFSSLVFARAGCFSKSWQQIAHNFKDSTCGSDFALRRWSWTRLWIRLWLWSWIVLSARLQSLGCRGSRSHGGQELLGRVEGDRQNAVTPSRWGTQSHHRDRRRWGRQHYCSFAPLTWNAWRWRG